MSSGENVIRTAALELDNVGVLDRQNLLVGVASTGQAVLKRGEVNAVNGALTLYDLPNLAATLEDKLTIEEPLDAMGKPL